MSAALKGFYWKQLKELGIEFELPYRNYTLAQLRDSYEALVKEGLASSVDEDAARASYQAKAASQAPVEPQPQSQPTAPTAPTPASAVPVSSQSVHEHAAERAYSAGYDEEPVRIDPVTKFVWFREEVRKPASPRPRARRKLTYVDPGTKTMEVSDGRYVETVEVSGQQRNTGEVRITMPSYQVGVYLDPKFKDFKIHVYNDVRGFDLFDVQKFYGGADLVPAGIKRIYVGNDLCYDMLTVIRTIEEEYNRLRLQDRT